MPFPAWAGIRRFPMIERNLAPRAERQSGTIDGPRHLSPESRSRERGCGPRDSARVWPSGLAFFWWIFFRSCKVPMSASPPQADIRQLCWDVRYVPLTDMSWRIDDLDDSQKQAANSLAS